VSDSDFNWTWGGLGPTASNFEHSQAELFAAYRVLSSSKVLKPSQLDDELIEDRLTCLHPPLLHPFHIHLMSFT